MNRATWSRALPVVVSVLVVAVFVFPSPKVARAAHDSAIDRLNLADGTASEANSYSFWTAVSDSGRYIAFASMASNLVAGDTNNASDVFLRDQHEQTTVRVSISSSGDQANNSSGQMELAISDDGRFIAFLSGASNLVPGDTNGQQDVFVHDMETGDTTRANVTSLGEQADDESAAVDLSPGGRFVVFESEATNLVPGDTNDADDVFLHDLETGETEMVSVDSEGLQGEPVDGLTDRPSVSSNGRYVAFVSDSVLVPEDTNETSDVYVRDRQAGLTTRVSVTTSGQQTTWGGDEPAISDNGRFVAFASYDTFGDSSDQEGDDADSDIFAHDRLTGTTERVSVSQDPLAPDANGPSYGASISDDGRFIAFTTSATNLAPATNNEHVAVFDRVTKRTVIPSACGNARSFSASLSGSGTHVAFDSESSDLVSDDTNGTVDLFLRNLNIPITECPGLSYVAFGDSLTTGYSVGTCAEAYTTRKNGCAGARPATPYPQLVADGLGWPYSQAFERVGVWGARLERAVAAYENGPDVSTEGPWTPQLQVVDEATDVVTGALGINDLEFSDVLHWFGHCVEVLGCESHMLEHLASMDADLDKLFDILGDAEARNAHVLVTLYYNPYEDMEGCDITYSIAETITYFLDRELRNRADAVGVESIDLRPVFRGHGAGSADPYVFGLTCKDTDALALLPQWVQDSSFTEKAVAVAYDPHPNIKGSEAIADMILEAVGQ